MLRSFRDFQEHILRATDGEVGKADDFLLEDLHWNIRYLIVETGDWLGRRVLISPKDVEDPHWQGGIIPIALTKKQIQTSPDIDLKKSVSRQDEERFANHFGLPFYWLYRPGFGPYSPLYGVPNAPLASSDTVPKREETPAFEKAQASPHLQSAHQMLGYKILAIDGKAGQLADFGFDPETWTIRYLIVEFGPVFAHKRVMIPIESVKENDWQNSLIRLKLSREEVENSSELDPAIILNPGKSS